MCLIYIINYPDLIELYKTLRPTISVGGAGYDDKIEDKIKKIQVHIYINYVVLFSLPVENNI